VLSCRIDRGPTLPASYRFIIIRMEDILPTIVVLIIGFAIYRWFFKSSESIMLLSLHSTGHHA
jgi:hypothetical protein